mmetsp:Transcript_6143/g.10982  ORF Transcript_6143/g.10982 Transcript_6143/m.10982 type:complete len:201 (+) Transcript_6143:89-691(+)
MKGGDKRSTTQDTVKINVGGKQLGDKCIQHSTSIGTMKLIKQRICDAELHHDMLLIAANCYTQFISGRTTFNVRNGDMDLKHNLYFYDQKTAMDILNCYLDKFYGLQASQQNKLSASDSDLVLKVKEVASEVQVGDNQESTLAKPLSRFSSAPFDETFEPFGGGTVMKVTPLNLRDSRGCVLSQDDFIRALDRALTISLP